MDILTIKVHANGSLAFWADSNHQDDLPPAQFKVGDKVTYETQSGDLNTGVISFVYIACDIEYLMPPIDKARYHWHYGLDMGNGFPIKYRTEWELLNHNPKPQDWKQGIQVVKPTMPQEYVMSNKAKAEAIEWLMSANKIPRVHAIKAVREIDGCSLVQAKRAVDNLAEVMGYILG